MKRLLKRLRGLWSGRPSVLRSPPQSASRRLPVLVTVEGVNDVHFLKVISTILSHNDPTLPDLQTWERDGHCLFLPTGGDVASWTMRLAALRVPQLHLYDREAGAVTDARRTSILPLRLQPHSRAFLTEKRSLENYLHADAVREGLKIDIVIDDETPVAEAAAQAILRRATPARSWDVLPLRSRKRKRDKAKRLLNTVAIRHMTPARLEERDPHGEVTHWLRTIVDLSMID